MARVTCTDWKLFPSIPERFGNTCRLYEGVQGAFYFHPNEQSPLVGTPERKKHLVARFRFTAIPKML